MAKRQATYFADLEKKRKQAFESRNALTYFLICEELGIEPEAQDLYEQGQLEAELELTTKVSHNDVIKKSDSRYMNFYSMGRYLDERGFGKDVESKRKLLVDCFPGRFGRHGKQPLENMEEVKIGSLFEKMMKYANKRLYQ